MSLVAVIMFVAVLAVVSIMIMVMVIMPVSMLMVMVMVVVMLVLSFCSLGCCFGGAPGSSDCRAMLAFSVEVRNDALGFRTKDFANIHLTMLTSLHLRKFVRLFTACPNQMTLWLSGTIN